MNSSLDMHRTSMPSTQETNLRNNPVLVNYLRNLREAPRRNNRFTINTVSFSAPSFYESLIEGRESQGQLSCIDNFIDLCLINDLRSSVYINMALTMCALKLFSAGHLAMLL